METKQLKVIIPEGYMVDKEKSTDINIILKPIIKGLTYDEVAKELFAKNDMYYIADTGYIAVNAIDKSRYRDSNNATSKYQLRCILAKNKLANVAIYLNNGWEPDANNSGVYLVLYTKINKIDICCCEADGYTSSRIVFKSGELAREAIEILGESEIRLALRPLY